jgi:predicted TIM-barrel fold metal-dependent hydrolase
MKMLKFIVLVVATSLVLSAAALRKTGRLQATRAAAWITEGQNIEELMRGFASIHPVDVHAHVFDKDNTAFFGMLKSLDLHVVDILVAGGHPGLWSEFATSAYGDRYSKGLDPQRSDALAVVRRSGGRAVLCTTFDPYKFADPEFAEHAIEQLNKDFAGGAVAVKIWKNLGMEIRKADGSFLMPDDPILEPIYNDIEKHHRTLIAHLAEPDVCWQPPDPNNPELSYFRDNPRWYMYLHPDYPSKKAILAARDHILEKNPKLRFIGAHMGSMESDVDQIAERLDKYPNFAVETGDRLYELMIQPREKVLAFLIKYQDRVLYGTDLILPRGANKGALDRWRATYARDWGLFATDETIELEGRKFRGLMLPESVLRKLFHDNALKWVPGVIRTDSVGNNKS